LSECECMIEVQAGVNVNELFLLSACESKYVHECS